MLLCLKFMCRKIIKKLKKPCPFTSKPCSFTSKPPCKFTSKLQIAKKHREHPVSQIEGFRFLVIDWDELQIEGPIGKGSFGFVRRARWKDNDVAVKLIDPQEGREMVKVVQEIMSRLKPHPNVIQILGQCESPKRELGLVMPFYSIGSLRDHLYGRYKTRSEHIKFDLLGKLFMIFDICAGLRQLHINDIMHLDVAARNVLLWKDRERYHACISDFSMSKFVDDHTKHHSEEFKGPLKWMPPEFLKEGKRTTKCDIFSLAITAWEILHEEPPWKKLKPMDAALCTLKNQRPAFNLSCKVEEMSQFRSSLRTMMSTFEEESNYPEGVEIIRMSALSTTTSQECDTRRSECSKKRTEGAIVQKLCEEIKHCWQQNPDDRPDIHHVHDSLITLFDALFSIDLTPYDEHRDEGHEKDYQTIRRSDFENI